MFPLGSVLNGRLLVQDSEKSFNRTKYSINLKIHNTNYQVFNFTMKMVSINTLNDKNVPRGSPPGKNK